MVFISLPLESDNMILRLSCLRACVRLVEEVQDTEATKSRAEQSDGVLLNENRGSLV